MSNTDKLRNEAEDAKGKAKEKWGEVTDDDSLEAEGRGDQAEAGMKKAGENAKDAASDAKDAVKDAFN